MQTLMRYRSCFSSVCESGYGIDEVKSGIQKYLRRREPEKMKWCVKEIYLFVMYASDEKEKKIARGIFTNLLNRMIVMLDEEMVFDEVRRYLIIRREMVFIKAAAEAENHEVSLNLLYTICDLMCGARLLRLGSDINAYFGRNKKKEVVYSGKETVGELLRDFILYFEQKDTKCYYSMYALYGMGELNVMTEEMEQIPKKKFYRKKEPIYCIINYLENLAATPQQAKQAIAYRLESFYDKEKKERALFLIAMVNIIMYMDEIGWKEKVRFRWSNVIEGGMTLDDYCIDMHSRRGRRMGKDKKDFGKEGCFVVNEYEKYKNQAWRDYYIEEKMGAPEAPIAPPVAASAQEFISMDEMQFVRLCSNSVCGGKVMCFVVEYGGQQYVLKEGRKSMNYNADYEFVDSCKEIFGLEKIGMRRIISDKIIVKIDKTKKEWENNWGWVATERAVYCMMNLLDAEKIIDFWRKNEKTEKDMREFMKIGLYRGIFGVSDFSTINVMRTKTGNIVSIDEHGVLGDRVNMIGQKNMKFYKENSHLLEYIFEDLYKDKEEKKEWINKMAKIFGFENVSETIIANFENLKTKFYEEYNR